MLGYEYWYDSEDDYLYQMTTNDRDLDMRYKVYLNRDRLMRLTQKQISLDSVSEQNGGNTYSPNVSNVITYSYADGINENTTGLLQSYSTTINGSGTTYNLTYDDNGNITSVSLGSYVINRYYYDDLGRMVREDSREKNRTYYYTYDDAGNLLYKEAFELTIDEGSSLSGKTPIYTYAYTYSNESWGDLMTSYRGHTIDYDAIGNPIHYYGRTSYTFTWMNGRQLATAVTGGKTLSFTYNDEEIRTSKTVNGVKHTYTLDGSWIMTETWGNEMLVYLYDDEGMPMGMMYRTSSYAEGEFDYYLLEKDVFGNIVAIQEDKRKNRLSKSS